MKTAEARKFATEVRCDLSKDIVDAMLNKLRLVNPGLMEKSDIGRWCFDEKDVQAVLDFITDEANVEEARDNAAFLRGYGAGRARGEANTAAHVAYSAASKAKREPVVAQRGSVPKAKKQENNVVQFIAPAAKRANFLEKLADLVIENPLVYLGVATKYQIRENIAALAAENGIVSSSGVPIKAGNLLNYQVDLENTIKKRLVEERAQAMKPRVRVKSNGPGVVASVYQTREQEIDFACKQLSLALDASFSAVS